MKGKTIWLTGLPCSGKTTIASKLKETKLSEFVFLDGDIIRDFVKNKDMSQQGRMTHLSYISYICRILNDLGHSVICSFVSPTNEIREKIRETIGDKNMFLVFVDCPKDVCIERDVKGMWRKALNGEIREFTGHDSPWEDPEDYDLRVETGNQTPEESCDLIFRDFLENCYLI